MTSAQADQRLAEAPTVALGTNSGQVPDNVTKRIGEWAEAFVDDDSSALSRSAPTVCGLGSHLELSRPRAGPATTGSPAALTNCGSPERNGRDRATNAEVSAGATRKPA